MGQIIRRSLFLVLYIRFLFESLKLFREFPPRFNQISGCSKLFKYFNIFPKILPSSKFFLFHVNVSHFSTLYQKSFFSWTKPVLAFAQIGWKITSKLLYRSGGVRNYFLYKVLYLPIKDMKRFGQSGLKVRTWEPWL